MLAFVEWGIDLVLNLVVTAIAMIIAPVLPAFADDHGILPSWLNWFQTQDNTLDGDDGWKTEHFVGYPRYLKRILWLWRNPAYGFSQCVLAARLEPSDTLTIYGDPKTSNIPGHSGWVWRQVNDINGLKWFQIYVVWQYPFKPDRCLRLNFGWKLWDFYSKQSAAFVSSIGFWNQYNV